METLKFDDFELTKRPLSLMRSGHPVALQLKPLRLISLLASRPGELVSHEEIQAELWNGRTVDFSRSIHVCVRQARNALGDDASVPHFIENVPRQGYRFIMPVESTTPSQRPTGQRKSSALRSPVAAVVAVVIAVGVFLGLSAMSHIAPGDHVNRAEAYVEAAQNLWQQQKFVAADQQARQALILDDSLADAYVILGAIDLMHEWDREAAYTNLSAALERDPENADAHSIMAAYYVLQKEFETARHHIQSAIDHSRGSLAARMQLARIHYYAGDYQASAKVCAEILDLKPDEPMLRHCLIQAYGYSDQYRLARTQAEAFMKQAGASDTDLKAVNQVSDAELLTAFETWRLAHYENSGGAAPYSSSELAMAAAGAGNFKQALFYANLALNERCSMLPFIAVDPVFTPITKDKKFRTLLAKINS